jgi:hypothetical protein
VLEVIVNRVLSAKQQLEKALCKTKAKSGLVMELHPKGVAVRGIKRNPLVLSVQQWRKVIAGSAELAAYLDKHESELK